MIDRNILRLAATEMLHIDDVPPRVSHPGSDRAWPRSTAPTDSPRFVNGVLDALMRSDNGEAKRRTFLKLIVANWQDRQESRGPVARRFTSTKCSAGWRVAATMSRCWSPDWPGAPARDTPGRHDRAPGRFSVTPTTPSHRFYYREQFRAHRFDVFVEDLNKVPHFCRLWAGRPVALLVHHLFGSDCVSGSEFPGCGPDLAAGAAARPDLPERTGRCRFPEHCATTWWRAAIQPGHIRVIENGVDTEHYSPTLGSAAVRTPYVLYLGRLQRYKRVDLIVEAFARVASVRPEARLVIAGNGDR